MESIAPPPAPSPSPRVTDRPADGDRVFRHYDDTATYKAIFAGGEGSGGPALLSADLQGGAALVLPRPKPTCDRGGLYVLYVLSIRPERTHFRKEMKLTC